MEDPEELFAACQFEEASKLAKTLLLEDEEEEEGPADQVLTDGNIDELDFNLGGPDASCMVRLVEECDRSDRLAVVLLQCAFELRREEGDEEEHIFCGHYSRKGCMPFPVAMIWLQIGIARGKLEYAKKVLLDIHTLIRSTIDSSDGEGGQGGDAEAAKEELMSMYIQVMDLLITKVMVPLGEREAMGALLKKDVHLQEHDREKLLESCQGFSPERWLGNGGRRTNGSSKARRRGGTGGEGANSSQHQQQHHQHQYLQPPTSQSSSRASTPSSLRASPIMGHHHHQAPLPQHHRNSLLSPRQGQSSSPYPPFRDSSSDRSRHRGYLSTLLAAAPIALASRYWPFHHPSSSSSSLEKHERRNGSERQAMTTTALTSTAKTRKLLMGVIALAVLAVTFHLKRYSHMHGGLGQAVTNLQNAILKVFRLFMTGG